MSASPRDGASPPAQDGPDALQAWLSALRGEGASRLDPVRFHYLEALARRLPGQPAPVRRILQDKLHAALTDYAARFAQGQPAAGEARKVRRPARKPGVASCAPLAELNQYLRDASPASGSDGAAGETHEQHEMASVRRFRRAWSHGRTQDQVTQATARKPVNAGPLNSHVLVLQSLALMQDLSPDYLRRFLVQVESLQWLEQASERYPPQGARQAKAAKPVKPARRGGPKKK